MSEPEAVIVFPLSDACVVEDLALSIGNCWWHRPNMASFLSIGTKLCWQQFVPIDRYIRTRTPPPLLEEAWWAGTLDDS